MPMRYQWDADKAASNEARHGVSFEAARQFDWTTALALEDRRYDYRETRWRSLGRISDRVHVIVFTWRADVIRIISLRKANSRGVLEYEQS